MAKAVSTINKAVVGASSGELLVALKSPAPALRSLTDECAESYQSKLREAVEEKRGRGEGPGLSPLLCGLGRVHCVYVHVCVRVHVCISIAVLSCSW